MQYSSSQGPVKVSHQLSDLRKTQLLALVVVYGVLSWAYFAYSAVEPGRADGGPLLLVLAVVCAASLGLRQRLPRAASWVYCLGLIATAVLIIQARATWLTVTIGVTVVIVASMLLTMWEALILTATAWAATAWSWASVAALPDGNLVPVALLQTATLYGLVFVAVSIGHDSSRRAVEWALAAWDEATQALASARDRRGEVLRISRALEEAMYRIERMNRELIVARRDAEMARAQKARLTAMVSHELRGPLNLILGFSRIMALRPESYSAPLPEPFWADIDAIYRNSQHLAALIDDVLDLSRIEVGRLPLVKDRIDLNDDVVERAVDIVRPLAERKGIRIEADLGHNLPWILADQVRLRQALLNLLLNAVRLTEEGGVTVTTELADRGIRIKVQDTGPGIPPSEVPKLFREFSQVPQVSRQKEDTQTGSGLGLSISKQLVELHNGKMEVESVLGRGTVFTMHVPLPGATPTSTDFHLTEGAPGDNGSESCIVVHSDVSIEGLLYRYMEGYRIVTVSDPQEAAELARRLHPRALICTLVLMQETQQHLEHLGLDVPVIGCRLPQANDAISNSLVMHLVKPISPDLLDSVMRQVGKRIETTVLVVDDDPDAVRLVEQMLSGMTRPYRIIRAFDGQSALRQMRSHRPDVVLLDVVMPGLSGYEVLEMMEDDKDLEGIKVVLVSARDWSEQQMMVGTPITMQCDRGVDMAAAARCLSGLMDAVGPRYLPTIESA